MLKGTYTTVTDEVTDVTWETWIRAAMEDNERRFESLKILCAGKDVLEFGCGSGGFLRNIRNIANSVAGIELMDEARDRLSREGIEVYKSLKELDKRYDVVCMFMVIEHLNDPDMILKQIYDSLKSGGLLICETPNAEDVLISKYQCRAFEDFTYWSEHVILFNSENLEKMILRNGFTTKINTQIQRYPLSNHLYWLSQGKPGGHVKWTEFNDEKMNVAYERILAESGAADTLWYVGEKKVPVNSERGF